MQDALVVIDAFDDFDHEDGEALLDDFRARVPVMEQAIASARVAGIPLVCRGSLHASKSDAAAVVDRRRI